MPFFTTALATAADSIADRIDGVSLHTGAPGSNGTNNEVSGNAYARATTSGSNWTETGSVSSNNAVIQFATPTGSWGTVTHFVVWDGNVALGSEALTTSRAVATGSDVEFAVGVLTVTVPSS